MKLKKYEEVIHKPEFIKLKEEINQNIDMLIDEYNKQIDEYINKTDILLRIHTEIELGSKRIRK